MAYRDRIIIFFISIFFLACQTGLELKDKDLSTIIVNEIEEDLGEGSLYEVYKKSYFYKDRVVYTDYLKLIKNGLEKKLEEYYSNNSLHHYLTTLANLENLGASPDNRQLSELIFNYIDSKNELNMSDIHLLESQLRYDDLSDTQLQTLLEQFQQIANSNDYSNLIQVSRGRGIDVYQEEENSNYLDGLITVFVNNGVTFINGVGSQDLQVGSGFFIDKQGYAITNYHVISSVVDPKNEGKADIYVKLNGSIDKVPCKVVGWDPVFDLALLKVSAVPEYYYSLKSSDNLKIGDDVIALGSPGGLGSTVTSGIVSATNRELLELGSVIQIDSAINPGSSGGPLIDENRMVTNIVFAGIESFEGVNFAIPVKYLLSSLEKLYLGDEVKHNWLGLGLTKRKASLEVIYVKPYSSAYYMGLEKGDIIKSLDGINFTEISEIQDYLITFETNHLINLEYKRNNETFNTAIPLETRASVVMKDILDSDTEDHLYVPLFGMDLSFTGKLIWNREYEVLDVYPGTVADDLDLNIGDIVEIKRWRYFEEYSVVVLDIILQTKQEGFWKKSIQITRPISVNIFI